METREVERFKVRSEDGSYSTTIVVCQDLIDAGTRANPSAVIPGLKTAQTIDGYHCNPLGKDRFEIVELGVNVQRVTDSKE